MSAIQSTAGVTSLVNAAASQSAGASKPEGFSELIADLLRDANGQQVQANQSLESFAAGETDSVQDVVLAMAKADMSFRFLLELRNQLIESYQEISRMQV